MGSREASDRYPHRLDPWLKYGFTSICLFPRVIQGFVSVGCFLSAGSFSKTLEHLDKIIKLVKLTRNTIRHFLKLKHLKYFPFVWSHHKIKVFPRHTCHQTYSSNQNTKHFKLFSHFAFLHLICCFFFMCSKGAAEYRKIKETLSTYHT